MMGDPLADRLMIPVRKALESYGIKGDEKTAIYNSAYEAMMEAVEVITALESRAEKTEAMVERLIEAGKIMVDEAFSTGIVANPKLILDMRALVAEWRKEQEK